jgi:hypothetical protein
MISRVPFPNCRSSVIGLAIASNPENDGHLSPSQESAMDQPGHTQGRLRERKACAPHSVATRSLKKIHACAPLPERSLDRDGGAFGPRGISERENIPLRRPLVEICREEPACLVRQQRIDTSSKVKRPPGRFPARMRARRGRTGRIPDLGLIGTRST